MKTFWWQDLSDGSMGQIEAEDLAAAREELRRVFWGDVPTILIQPVRLSREDRRQGAVDDIFHAIDQLKELLPISESIVGSDLWALYVHARKLADQYKLDVPEIEHDEHDYH